MHLQDVLSELVVGLARALEKLEQEGHKLGEVPPEPEAHSAAERERESQE